MTTSNYTRSLPRFAYENEILKTGTWAQELLDSDAAPTPVQVLLDLNDASMLLDATVVIPIYKRPEPKFPQLTGRNRVPNWQLNSWTPVEREQARLKASGGRQRRYSVLTHPRYSVLTHPRYSVLTHLRYSELTPS